MTSLEEMSGAKHLLNSAIFIAVLCMFHELAGAKNCSKQSSTLFGTIVLNFFTKLIA